MKVRLLSLLVFFFVAFELTACINQDDPTDITKEVVMYVSSETGTMHGFLDPDIPVECMLVREDGEKEYLHLDLYSVKGFEYEKGYEYKLLVKKTTLANPPADGSSYVYELVRIVMKKEVSK